MVNIIHNYIHEYDLNYSDVFLVNLSSILGEHREGYENRKRGGGSLTDITLQNPIINNFIIPKLHKVVTDNFYVDPPLIEYGIRVYKQTSKEYKSALHSHIHIMHSISAVFYLNIPQEGGEIYFEYMKGSRFGNLELKLKPLINKVYLFPSWLPHTPLPHKDENITRLSFNWGYGSDARPRHKATGTIW